MSLQVKYQRLSERATSAKSIDYGRATIYVFDKHCRHCGKGLIKPRSNDRRTIRALWKQSYCAKICEDQGKRIFSDHSVTVKSGTPSHKQEFTVEELAFLGLELKRQDDARQPLLRLIHRAENLFSLLSEKLRFLEIQTGESWEASRFYYWLAKI